MFVGGKDGGSDAMLVIFETRKDTGRCWLALQLSFKEIARLRACECVQLGMCMCSRLVSTMSCFKGVRRSFPENGGRKMQIVEGEKVSHGIKGSLIGVGR